MVIHEYQCELHNVRSGSNMPTMEFYVKCIFRNRQIGFRLVVFQLPLYHELPPIFPLVREPVRQDVLPRKSPLIHRSNRDMQLPGSRKGCCCIQPAFSIIAPGLTHPAKSIHIPNMFDDCRNPTNFSNFTCEMPSPAISR